MDFAISWLRGGPILKVADNYIPLRDVRWLPAGLRRRIRKAVRKIAGPRWVVPTL